MPSSLRIIRDHGLPAEFNMAADRFLLDSAASSPEVFLRFYRWAPPAISLGCMQDPETHLDREALVCSGIDWVKRPTGGRAVLHRNDITYSCIFPVQSPSFGNTIRQSYALLSRCLLSGLELAGIACNAQDSAAEFAAAKRTLKLPCFLSPNRDEIMAEGKKLVGSAQKRTGKAVLQHGSIPVDGSFRQLPDYLVLPPFERDRQKTLLEKKCICLREIMPDIDREKTVDCLIKGFVGILGFDAVEKPWNEKELAEIKRLTI
jgi:lipoyl(octanoyl) transferase